MTSQYWNDRRTGYDSWSERLHVERRQSTFPIWLGDLAVISNIISRRIHLRARREENGPVERLEESSESQSISVEESIPATKHDCSCHNLHLGCDPHDDYVCDGQYQNVLYPAVHSIAISFWCLRLTEKAFINAWLSSRLNNYLKAVPLYMCDTQFT